MVSLQNICKECLRILVIFQVALARADEPDLLTKSQSYLITIDRSIGHQYPKIIEKDKVNGNYKKREVDYSYANSNSKEELSYLPPKIEQSYLPPKNNTNSFGNHKVKENHEVQNKDDKSYNYSVTTATHETSAEVNGNYKDNLITYQQSNPQVIVDPLPEKVNYVAPIILDFPIIKMQTKPLFTPAFAPTHLIPKTNIEPPTIRKSNTYRKGVQTSSSSHKTTTLKPTIELHESTTKPAKPTITIAKASTESSQYESKEVYRPEIKYPAYIKTAKGDEEILYINHHHGPKTKFELFNYHDSYALDSSPPEVIFKPGDDISFADDDTVIDDYVHTFPPVSKKAKATSIKPTKNPKTTLRTTKKVSDKLQTSTTTTVDSKSSEVSNSSQGYVYDKPKISFHT